MQQKLAQLLLLQLAACLLKAYFTHSKRKEVRRVHTFSTYVEMTEYTTADFIILKFVKKKKGKQQMFFLKKR